MDFKTQIKRETHRAIQAKVFPGCVIGITSKNGERQILPFGNFTYDKSSQLVKEDTIYDLASITKSIPTGILALKFIDEGRLKLTDKLINYIPEFKNSDRENILIKHLLTYTIDGYGFASTAVKITGKSIQDITSSDLQNLLFTQDFEQRPGKVFKYTNIPTALLGLVVEKIGGDTLANLAEENFFKPLKMNRTTFYPEKFSLKEIAPTEIDIWRGLVHGVVHDESAYIFKKEGKIFGHAGLFSTAPDILNLLEMILQKGVFHGRKYFSEKIIEQMETNQIGDLKDFTGLGWELNQPRFMGDYCNSHTFGKTGFTGTFCLCDVRKGIAYVILTNRIFPRRPNDSTKINAFRKVIGNIILKP
jgi:CubicO group peptidase (beta-lactamase class C family)